MSEPRRLLEGETDEWTRGLIESARSDGPSGRSCRKAAVALGLGAATVSAAGSTSATVVGTKVTMASVGALVVAKWVGVAAVGIATTAAVVHVVRHPAGKPAASHSATSQVATAAAAPATPARAAISSPEPPSLTAEPEPRPLAPSLTVPEPLRAGVAPSPRRATPPPTKELSAASPVSQNVDPPSATPNASPRVTAPVIAPATEVAPSAPTPTFVPPDNPTTAPSPARRSASTLFAETSVLDVARSALRAHDPARALPALDAYDARFPRGVLAPEAAVLRIEALAALGDREGAGRLSNAFLQAHPSSPFADRVRKLTPPVSIP